MSSLNLSQVTSRQKEREERANRPKANWFKIGHNEKKYVQFLQELSEDAERYNPKFGTFYGAVEHQAPGKDGFKARALDTRESEGRDWAQEQHEKNPKLGWHPRENFYINVATYNDDGEIEAQILSRNIHNQFVVDLIELYEESEGVGITGQTFEIHRRGTGPQTMWRIKPVDHEMDVSKVQIWDLEQTAVRHVPYEQQEEYYMRVASFPDDEEPAVAPKTSVSASVENLDW